LYNNQREIITNVHYKLISTQKNVTFQRRSSHVLTSRLFKRFMLKLLHTFGLILNVASGFSIQF